LELALDVQGLDELGQLVLRVNLQLISDLNAGHVQFEHIQPLLRRVESSLASLRMVLSCRGPRHRPSPR